MIWLKMEDMWLIVKNGGYVVNSLKLVVTHDRC